MASMAQAQQVPAPGLLAGMAEAPLCFEVGLARLWRCSRAKSLPHGADALALPWLVDFCRLAWPHAPPAWLWLAAAAAV
jgi:hypothetical protein